MKNEYASGLREPAPTESHEPNQSVLISESGRGLAALSRQRAQADEAHKYGLSPEHADCEAEACPPAQADN